MGKQKYDEAFKRNAVSLVESGQTAAQVARDLGLHANQLYEWCRRYRNRPSDHGNASSNQSEVERLRAERDQLRIELDILKKAIAIFSVSQPTSLEERLRIVRSQMR